MRENGFGRALRYFIRLAEEYVLYTAGLSIAMAVYMCFLNGNLKFLDMAAAVPGIMLYISGMMLAVTGMSAAQQWYSTLISLGCRRKNVFLGNLVMDLLFIVECMILFHASSWLLEIDVNIFTVPVMAAFYFVLGGFAKAGGASAVKWGKIAHVASVLMVLVMSMAFGIWILAASRSEDTAASAESFIRSLVTGRLSISWQWGLAAAGAVVYAAACGFSWRLVRSYEVRT